MPILDYITVSFLVIPLIILVLNNLFSKQFVERINFKLVGVVAILQMALAVAGFSLLSAAHWEDYRFSLLWDWTMEEAGYFAVNSLSLVFLFCIGFVLLVAVLVAKATVEQRKTAFVNLVLTLLLGMNGMVMVRDLFSLYVFLEIVGISSFVLVALFQLETGLEGAFKYLVMSSLATVFILTGLAFVFMQTGSLQYAQAWADWLSVQGTAQLYTYLAFILLISGFALKTGVVPFHSWLPDAHQSANTAVSILLSGIVIKVAGIYGFIVLTKLFPGFPPVALALRILGLLSIVVGALFALRQTHFKRLVAYSSVSQMGYILLGLSSGTTLGFLGAMVHIFNHATFKSTLFTNAAALSAQAGTLELGELGGLEKKMPVTGFSSITAFLSTAGIPPLAGFWSKLLIIMALWKSEAEGFAAVALLASILTAAYFLRLQKKVFFGQLPEKFGAVTEIGGSVKFAELMLSAVNIAVGVGFPLILLFFEGRGLL
ncbi:MAG: NADH-quinone oxidoreductase subunit L [Firmicutes bacterium]|nr:NADH-quinone oxidoreductase subunit L [Bacillota bacterium]